MARSPRLLFPFMVIAGVLPPVSSAAAQESCPQSSAALMTAWVEPHSRATVAGQVPESMNDLGYVVREASPGGEKFVTDVKTSWPTETSMTPWKHLRYPGAEVSIALEDIGGWTRVNLSTRLVCETEQGPPSGFPPEIDFNTFVLNGTHNQVDRAIASSLARGKTAVPEGRCSLLRQGEPALAVCRQILKVRPDDPEMHRQYAIQLANSYQSDKVWAPLKKVFELEGERIETFVEVGAAMLRNRGYQDAARLYERGIELWPGDARMVFGFGRAKLDAGDFPRAASSLVAASKLDPVSPAIHWYAAVALAYTGRAKDALVHCDEAAPGLADSVAARPFDHEAWLGLSYCAFTFGQYPQAIACFERALDADPVRSQDAEYVLAAVRKSLALSKGAAPGGP